MNTTLNINYSPYAPGQFAITFTVNGTAPNLSTGYSATIRVWRSGLPTTATPDYIGTDPSPISLGTNGSIILDLVVIHSALNSISSTNAVWMYDLIVTPSSGYSQKVCSGQLAEGVGADDDVDVTAPISVTWAGQAGGDLSGNYPNPTVDGLQGRAVASTAPADGEVLSWSAANSRWQPAAGGGGGAITLSGDVQGLSTSTTVHKLQGHEIQTGTPSDDDVLQYDSTNNKWNHHSLAQAGISAVGHKHSGSDIDSGTVAPARLGSGTPSSANFLRGDSSWQLLPTYTQTTVSELTYTSSGTYSKPAGLQYIIVEGVGGGGGGGAGSTTAGGNGGCAGLYATMVIPAALITTATLVVTVGTGGGAGATGGDSEIAIASGGARLLLMPGGRAATNDMRNLTGGVTTNGFGAGQTAANATAARHGGYGPGGGGPGQTNTTGAGLAGGRPSSHEFTGGNAQTGGGAAGGANGGGAGTTATVTVRGFGEGAGGGGANNAGTGGAGGNGVRGSGGGGGGRGSTAGGAGGSGGDGYIRIIEVVVA